LEKKGRLKAKFGERIEGKDCAIKGIRNKEGLVIRDIIC